MKDFVSIVLAAGQGKRMRSGLSKVLHRAAGRPLVHYAVQTSFDAGASKVVVVASPNNQADIEQYLEQVFDRERAIVAVQDPPLGTGDAARVGLEAAGKASEWALILCADVPLVTVDDVMPLIRATAEQRVPLALLSCVLEDPESYGRIVRDGKGAFQCIREARDLENDAERAIREINSGLYFVRTDVLGDALGKIRPTNAQGEYYLTDIVPHANRAGGALAIVGNERALAGVNDRAQLVQVEELLYERIRQRHAQGGVTVRGDARIDDTVEIEEDVEIGAGAALRGNTRVGSGTRIDVGCVITNMVIGRDCIIRPYTVMTDSVVGSRAELGPFTHLRPGCTIEDEAHLGNFVEGKKTRMRRGAKANHLSYLGDGDIGERSNIGAGTIFCNYDGFGKHQTTIGDEVFVGSDSQIVAPVTIGRGAYVGTGTTVTQDVPEDALAIGRVRQQNKEGYGKKVRARLKARSGK